MPEISDGLDLLAKIYELQSFGEFELLPAEEVTLSSLSDRVYALHRPREYAFASWELSFLTNLWTTHVEPLSRSV